MLKPLTVWITTNYEQFLKKWEYKAIQKLAILKFHCLKPTGSAGKETTCNVGDLGSIPELGRSPREGKGYPFQYSGFFALKATNLKYHRGKIFHNFILNMKTSIANNNMLSYTLPTIRFLLVRKCEF